MAKVVLENVSKKFGDVVAVEKINLEIKDEEFMVFVGPSGCGKTTTLRMIAGLEEITEGKIYIDDQLVNDVPPKDRNIAMVFQNYALYPHMKVYDNMAFGLKLRGTPKKEVEERVREAAQILGLEDLLDRYPKQLSGGQRQRVAVGRAIVRRPQVFLMDEPLSNLDAKLRVQMRAELQRLHKALKATVVYVTHDQVEAMTLGQRVAVILNGGLQQLESPLSVYEKPTNSFVAGFITRPRQTYVKGTIDKKDNRYTFKAESFEVVIPEGVALLLEPYIGKEVTFGIRPEDIWDVPSSDWIKDKLYLDTKVDFREIIGAETNLFVHVGKTTMVCRVNGLCDAKTGSDFKVVVNLSKLHFFDPRTQKAII